MERIKNITISWGWKGIMWPEYSIGGGTPITWTWWLPRAYKPLAIGRVGLEKLFHKFGGTAWK